jgi:acetyl-CoA acetyltransferase
MTQPTFRGATAIAGIGYSRSDAAPGGFSKRSNVSVLTLVARAVREACADAGIAPADIDGAVTYQVNDSVAPQEVLRAIGAREIRFEINQHGGGNYASQAILLAALAVHHGLVETCLVYRGMNGRSGVRVGGAGDGGGQARVGGLEQFRLPYGVAGAPAAYALQAARWMARYDVSSADLGAVAVQSRRHAAHNPRATMRAPITVDDHQDSAWIARPYHLLDCCLETDVACALLVTSTERARDLRAPLVTILAGVGGPTRFADLADTGFLYMRDRLFGDAGVRPDDVDLALLYDNFSDCPLRMIEHLGWCRPGESADYVRDGHAGLDGRRPMQTQGGLMNEGYCHGLNNALEAVQQLRGEAEDECTHWHEGKHTFDRSMCRQVRDPTVALHTGVIGKSAMLLMRA